MSKELDTYITELNNFADNLEVTVTTIGKKNELGIVKLQNDRLFKGYDALNTLIGGGVYAKKTIAIKSARAMKTSVVTLNYEGDWYGNMFVSGTKELIIDNRDKSLTSELMNGGGEGSNPPYGEAIVGLTTDEEVFLAVEIIDPKLQKIINKQISFIEL